MDLEHVYEFVTLVNVGNYQRAADRLFITQPTLTKHIKALEKELGYELLIRGYHQLLLTEKGRRFLTPATQIANTYESITRTMQSTGDRKNEFVVLVSLFRVLNTFPNLIVRFHKQFPDSSLRALQSERVDIVDDLVKTKACMAIFPNSGDMVEVEGYKATKLGDYSQMKVYLPANHRLADRSSIRVKELEGEKVIVLPDRAYSAQLAARVLEQAHVKVDRAYSVSRKESAIGFVQSGLSIFMGFSEDNEDSDGMAIVPLDPPMEVYTELLYADRDLTEEEKWLIGKLRQH